MGSSNKHMSAPQKMDYRLYSLVGVIFYPVGLGVVLQVHAGDDPAVRGLLAAPQRPVEAPPLRAPQDLHAPRAADLVDEPQAAPLVLLQGWTQQDPGDPRDLSLWPGVCIVLAHGVHGNKTAWDETKSIF